jgi:hypothetical protein
MPRVNKVVEKQSQLADEMYNKLYRNTEQSAPEGNEPAKPETVVAPSEEQVVEQSAPEAAAPAEAKPENADDQPKPKFPDADPNDKSWEQKYKVLANKYSAEVPRYAAEIRSLKAEIVDLKKSAEQKPAQTRQAETLVKPEEVAEYGEKFVDFVKRAAKEVVPSDVEELRSTVNELRNTNSQLERKRFFDELVGLSPTWESLNTDKEFLDWLGELDPYTGQQRQSLFDDAYAKLDAWRVANFFNAYNEGVQKKEPLAPKPSLADQVVPKTTGKTPPPQGKKIYSNAEVARFYADLRRNVYSPEEAQRIEKDIFAAQAEGRLR